MSKSKELGSSSKKQANGGKRAAPRRPAGQLAWEQLEIGLRGLRNLNAMQLELIASVEQIGKQLRRKRG